MIKEERYFSTGLNYKDPILRKADFFKVHLKKPQVFMENYLTPTR